MVRALANRTATEGRSADEFRDIFLSRFQALIDAQDLQTTGASSAGFADIVARSARLAASKEAFVADGPPVTVAAHYVLPLTLLLHELTTNALKYGALSAQGGRVEVTWLVVDADGAGETLRIEWRERDGPPVSPPTRSGFGTELIQKSLRYDLNFTTETHFDPTGFRASFSMPIG